MASYPTEFDALGPVEGFAHRAEHTVADTMRHLMHHGAPQPAAQPAPPQIPHTENQEEHMSSSLQWVTDAEEHIKAALGKFQEVDHEAQAKFEAVTANPATRAIFLDLASIAHLPLTAGELATAENVVKMTLAFLGGQVPAPAQQPA